MVVFFFQAEDGIRDLVRSRGLGDVYKRQILDDLARAGLGLGQPLIAELLDERYDKLGAADYGLSLIHI